MRVTIQPVPGMLVKYMSAALMAGLLCGLAMFPGTASAQRVEGTRAVARGAYEAEVTVRSQTESERKAGFARALAQVLGKLSGDRSAAGQPGVADELRRAQEYVDSYDYRQDEGVSAVTGAPTFDTTLIVRFDRDKVDGIAGALGLPIWPEPRPKPVLWLAIDDGSGPRLVALSQADAARSVLDRARQRGYKLGLPTGTAAEQAVVGAIWRGDTAAIARISARYQPPMQLIGKLSRANGGWHADWTFLDNGRVLSSWSIDDASARSAMATGADGAADALMRRYAKRTPVGPAGTYMVRFEGIKDGQDYMRLIASLENLSVVRQIAPVHASADVLELNLTLVSGIAGLRRMLDDNLFQTDDAATSTTTTDVPPTFRLR